MPHPPRHRLKACLAGPPVCLFRRLIILIAQVIGIVPEEFKPAVPVNTGMRAEEVSVNGFKIELIRETRLFMGVSAVTDIVCDIQGTVLLSLSKDLFSSPN